MAIVVLIFIIYALAGDRKNIFTARQFDTIKKVILGLIMFSIFGGALMPSIGALIGLTIVLGAIIAPPIVFFMILNSIFGKKKKDIRYNQSNDSTGSFYADRNQRYDKPKQNVKSSLIPKQASKRRKIIEKFNKKYELFLTESQIQRIVDASYYSVEWEREISDMSKEYASVYEWFTGNTAWLRAYLKSFRIQNISSDFGQQKQICFNELDQVFRDTDLSASYADEARIREVNDKFFTNFDDISFMIAYRFLEANGRKYDIGGKSSVIKNEDEAETLAHKYEKMMQ